MLIIHHLTGALAGKETRIESSVERVTFGRQVDCEVSFPPEETQVARHHFALVHKPSGSWVVELFGEPYVAMNGMPADPGQPVRDGATFELGSRGGPSFKIEIQEDARTDNMERTKQQQDVAPARVIAIRAQSVAYYARRFALLALLLAVIAGGVATYNWYTEQANAARFDAANKEFAARQASEANLRIGAEVRARVARAVYHVQLRDAEGRYRGSGTAWVVGPHLLATNAHVALDRDGLREKEEMVVRAPGQDGAVYVVVEHKIHPGYVPFTLFSKSDLRLFGQYRGSVGAIFGNGYDVAILRVAETLPEDARLEIASQAELEALSVGNPVGTAGYPTEGLTVDSAQLLAASPEQHVGVITALTDLFQLPSAPPRRQLIHHDLPSTGGQSGSPMVAASGHVIGLLNSVNFVFLNGVRIPNAALVNFAQRADYLRDLIDGTAEAKLPEERKYWDTVTADLFKGNDVLPQLIVERANPGGMVAKLVSETSGTSNAKSGKRVQDDGPDRYEKLEVARVTLVPGYDYLFSAYFGGGSAQLGVVVDGTLVAKEAGINFPAIVCRLLTADQQVTDDPKKNRLACVSGDDRTAAMAIAAGSKADTPRDVAVVILNSRTTDDPLANVDLKYVLRVYQWVPGGDGKPNS
jgi:hypothetical protein